MADPDIYGSHDTPYGSHDVAYGGSDSTPPDTLPDGLYDFSPPVAPVGNPSVLLDPRERRRNPLGWRLFRHFGSSPRALNVYKLADDTYTTIQPIYTSVNHSVAPPNLTVTHIYYGATVSTVDRDEAQRLVNAGFTVTPH